MNPVDVSCENIIHEIKQWKEKRNAVILAHNYQINEIQDIADYTGDSLELSRKAAATTASTIVFCGVHFMAESAKILSPDKTVLLPAKAAGCSMADMVTAPALRKMKAEHPDAAVVAYVNSTAEVKAESDYCCTSANAVNLVNAIPEKKIIFVPDKNLGQWVAKHTDKEIILWEGFCAIHDHISETEIEHAKQAHPQALLLVHPECRPAVCDQADAVLSTSQMLKYVQESNNKEFIIGTEIGLLHPLKLANPGKKFFPVHPNVICQTMKLTSLDNLLSALQNLQTEIDIPREISSKAVKALEAMINYS